MRVGRDEVDPVAGRDLSFDNDTEVVAAPSCSQETSDHSRVVEADSEFEAG